jgi:integrase
MRKTLSDKGVAALKPRAARYAVPDPELCGLFIRVQPTGSKTYAAVTVAPSGKQIWTTIGRSDAMSIREARTKARRVRARVQQGLPADDDKPNELSFEEVAKLWLERHVRRNGLRSESEILRQLRMNIFPAWSLRPFLGIRRSDIAALLDEVEDRHGARQADYVLAITRSIMNFHALRDDDYVPPIARGMRRQSPHAQARARILSDDELRLIWHAAETDGTFGALIRLCLLTAQRRTKVLSMRWDDVTPVGEWTIPTEPREKGNPGKLRLPNAAIATIRAQPHTANPYVLAGRADGPFRGLARAKTRFDGKLPAMPRWTLHDLRRSARSLMSRAGIRPEIAERVLGHVVGGTVQQTYDRHDYASEIEDALLRLAALIESIVVPRENVIPLQRTK